MCLIHEVIAAMDHEYLQYMTEADPVDFRGLMESYGQDVWDFAYVLTKSHHHSDDIFQEVFLKAYKNIASFHGKSSVRTWLIAITRNTAYNYMRSAFLRKVTLMDWISPKQTSPSAEKEYFAQAVADDIWEMVLRLPAPFREVLLLDAKYKMPLKDIAETLGVAEGTVKSRLYRARAKISRMLEEAD